MTELRTLRISLYGTAAGAVIGMLALLIHPGSNDLTLLGVWIGVAGLSAVLGSAVAGALSGTWNLLARLRP
jgi:hypothetical protein